MSDQWKLEYQGNGMFLLTKGQDEYLGSNQEYHIKGSGRILDIEAESIDQARLFGMEKWAIHKYLDENLTLKHLINKEFLSEYIHLSDG